MIVSAQAVGRWMQQVTTGHGFALVGGAVAGLLTHSMPPDLAVPMLVSGAICIVWPERTDLQKEGAVIAREAMTISPMLLPPTVPVGTQQATSGKG